MNEPYMLCIPEMISFQKRELLASQKGNIMIPEFVIEYLVEKGADGFFTKALSLLTPSEQDKVNKDIISAYEKAFKYGDTSKWFLNHWGDWLKDIKNARTPQNALLTYSGLHDSLRAFYPQNQNSEEERNAFSSYAKKLYQIMLQYVADSSAVKALFATMEAEKKEQEAVAAQASRDRRDDETYRNSQETAEGVRQANKKLDEIIEGIGRPSDNRSVQPVTPSDPELKPLPSDTQDYADCFSEPLFLDQGNDNITLASMYVSPHIAVTDKSASDYIRSWYSGRKSCLLLYGDAGIGKTSLISKIAADACGITEPDTREYGFTEKEVLIAALRDHKESFERMQCDEQDTDDQNKLTPYGVLCDLFGVSDRKELCGRLLILDGLDELLVLSKTFTKDQMVRFIRTLASERHGLRILMTTRADYFDLNSDVKKKLESASLCWTKDEVKTWCQLYGEKKPEKAVWCNSFPEKYDAMPQKSNQDKRREIFCIPIILYLACNADVDLEQETTVGKIYEKAFRSIIMREHSETWIGNTQLEQSPADIRLRRLHWQFTKELAYQMYFLGNLELLDDESSDDPKALAFRRAKKRTVKILKEDYTDLTEAELNISQYLAVFHFAKSKERNGITFAHRTVYEYFTALKLYEDYFAKFSKEYIMSNTETAGKEIFEAFTEAFRYSKIELEIISYMVGMESPAFLGVRLTSEQTRQQSFDKESFLTIFQEALKEGKYSDMTVKPAIPEYLQSSNYLNTVNVHFSRAISNFTWYLTALGYLNQYADPSSKELMPQPAMDRLLSSLCSSESSLCCIEWNLYCARLNYADLQRVIMRGANLCNAHLHAADLRNAEMEGAKLLHADLSYARLCDARMENTILQVADLSNADLRIAKMIHTNLRGAKLKWAVLRDAELQGTDLRSADLSGADLRGVLLRDVLVRGAQYCKDPQCCTQFPEDFDPHEYDMIEVDFFGNPV